MRLLIITVSLLAFYSNSNVLCRYIASPRSNAGNSVFWHVTDMHFDQNYSMEAGDPSKMCWDVATGQHLQLGEFGDYSCDAPLLLLNSTIRTMKSLQGQPDFIVWTGDDTSHVDSMYLPFETVINVIRTLTGLINGTFPTTPVVPVLGNHDNYPKHNFWPGDNQLYTEVAEIWKDWLAEGYETFKHGGFYSKFIPGITSVKMIGLNTPLYYNKNHLVGENNTDPADQFAWLENELTMAAVQGYKVYLVAHVPSGVFERKVLAEGFTWMKPQFNKRFNSIIVQHAAVIAGQFFGHHHTDSFKVFYDAQGVPVSYMLIAPAVTPWNTTLSGIGPNNPGVRLFEYNKEDAKVINYWQYYLPLGEANQNHMDEWQVEYDFLSAFGQTELSAASLNAVAQSFAPNSTDRTLFDMYYEYNSVSYVDATDCDFTCRQNHYCAITRVDYDDFRVCNSGAVHSQGNFFTNALPMLIASFFGFKF